MMSTPEDSKNVAAAAHAKIKIIFIYVLDKNSNMMLVCVANMMCLRSVQLMHKLSVQSDDEVKSNFFEIAELRVNYVHAQIFDKTKA